MPKLRRHRRDHRARAPKRIKRRNLVKFIPRADSDFAFTANCFVAYLKRDPEAYNFSTDEVAGLEKAVTAFRTALAKASVRFTRRPELTMAKDEARAEAERLVRVFANIIRADPTVSDSKKTMLRLGLRPKKLGKRKCPKHPPRLQFLGSGDGIEGSVGVRGGGSGIHVLRFSDAEDGCVIMPSCNFGVVRNAKPDGAVRLELYFDMIPTGEPVPVTPSERGWPKYLRSFTKNPMEVEYPIPVGGEPMLIVYWARWADSSGETGRWSKTCVARVEGWSSSRAALPGANGTIEVSRAATHTETKIVFIAPRELPPHASHRDELAEDLAALAAGGNQRLLEAA